jgi:WD40 repeat protein
MTIRLWEVATGVETARLEGHTGNVRVLCLLPDGRLASGSEDMTIRMWDAATGTETACLLGDAGRVYALCSLADGRLASGCEDKTVRLWDMTAGTEITRFDFGAAISAIAVIAPNRIVAGDQLGLLHWLEVLD